MITKPTNDNTEFMAGLNAAAELIASTIGPFGRNVSLAGGHERRTWDDGYKALKSFVPSNPMQREAVMRLLDAAKAQVSQVGDGTSTTTLLMVALYRAAMELLNSDRNIRRRQIIKEFSWLTDKVCEFLEEMSLPVTVDGNINADLVKAVATIAMHGNKRNGDLIGGLIAELGPYGIINFEKAPTPEVSVSRSTGYVWNEGVPDTVFFNQAGAVQLGESLVVVINDHDVDDIQTPFWNKILNEIWPRESKEAGKQLGLVLICTGAAGSVMSTFANPINKATGERFPMVILKAPGSGTADAKFMLSDIAAVTGARVFDTLRGQLMGDVSANDLGRVAGVRATATSSTLALMDEVDYGVGPEPLEKIISDLSDMIQLEYELLQDEGSQEQKKRRLAALNGAAGTIRIPMVSETGLSESLEEYEDGYRSAMSCVTDGVLPGGGKAFLAAMAHIRKISESDFCNAFCEAILFPGLMLTLNGVNISEEDSMSMASKPWVTVDMSNGVVGNALEIGVLDSKNVVISALRNAMSVAVPIINTEYWLVNQEA